MKNLYIFTDNYFLKKDFLRFEVNDLNKNFNFTIVSINKKIQSLNKKIKLVHIKKISDLDKFILKDKNIKKYVIDLMGIDNYSWKIRKYLSNYNVIFIKLMLGMVPFPPKKNLAIRILNNLNPQKKIGASILRKIENNFLIFLNQKFTYEYSFVAGKIAKNIQRRLNTKKIVDFKSFDTINYENTKITKIKKPPIVFIDNDIADHKDYKYHGTSPPVKKSSYLTSLNNFFNYIEKKFNRDIVIALNPKSDKKKAKKNFLNRKIFQNKTSQLIKNSKFSIIHSSTALSYSVLAYKPVLFITNNQIKKSWFQQEIDFSASQLNNKVLNIDNLRNDLNIYSYLNLNKKYYKNYITNYLYEKKINKSLNLSKILKLNLK